MRNKIIQVIVFLLCFLIGVIGINYIMGSNAGDYSLEMDKATLPLIYTRVEGQNLNCLHGYTSDVDASLLRDSLTPLEEGEDISLVIDNDDYEVSSIHYEVRSSDASSLVEDGDLTAFEKDKHGNLTTKLSVRMQLKLNQDYILKLMLKGEGGVDVTYYTRILFGSHLHIKNQLEFVKKFHEALFDKQDAEEIKQYLEPDLSKTSNDLGRVDITSSFEALTYADMKPQKLREAAITVTDVEQDIASVELSYVLSAESSGGNQEYYNALEQYRVRYTSSRMYLLSYNRTINSFYDSVFTSTANNSLKLGITESGDVPYLVSDDCKRVAFVKNRELYFYNYQQTQVAKVFSFLQEDMTDERDKYAQHDIKLIRMDDKGNLSFAVYGYMNRGRHEGQNGILFYQYRQEDNQIEELAFIPTSQPYYALKEDVNQVTYINEKNEITFTLLGQLLSIDLKTKKTTVLMEQVQDETVVSSEKYNMIAMLSDVDISNNKEIIIRNLDSGREQSVTADEGEVLRVIGFVEDDLVYGKVRSKDIVVRDSSTTFYPMYEISIMNEEGTIVKEYKPKGSQVVMTASITHSLVELGLSKYNGETFLEKGTYHIMSSEDEEDHSIVLDYNYNSVRYKELFIVFPNYVYVSDVPEKVITKEKRLDDNRTIEIEGESGGVLRYFVYVNGRIEASYHNIGEAVLDAAQNGGGVINSQQMTIWEKNGVKEYGTIGEEVPPVTTKKKEETMEACVAMILGLEEKNVSLEELVAENMDADELLSKYLEKEGVNVTGTSLLDSMYYVCQGHPVIAKRKDGSYILLTSYNSSLLKFTDPLTGEVYREDFETMRKDFEEAGNIFFSYLK